jgi:Putative peptidoglycan binding domain/LysM domain
MADYYTIKQGDYLSKIAAENGFHDHTVIWNHPSNARLKQERKNPNVLNPGDRLFIPDKQNGQFSRATDQRHRFVVKAERLKLRLILEDQLEKPISNAKCQLFVGSQIFHLTTDGKGKLEQDIPRDAEKSTLVIQSPETPFDGEFFQIRIGHLDPVETVTGQQARLNNLGYFAGASANPEDPAFRSAAEEFQCDHGLVVDGKIGANTQAKLKQVHGC